MQCVHLELRVQMDETLLDAQSATMYKAVVARLNYLAQDRSDIQFANFL